MDDGKRTNRPALTGRLRPGRPHTEMTMANPFARLPRDLGKLLFGVWLLLMGLVPLLKLDSAGLTVAMGVVLIASGVCFLLGR